MTRIKHFIFSHLHYFIPLISLGICFFTTFSTADNVIRDMFQRLLPPLNERTDVLLITIDDMAIEKVGTFPWTRNILADQLVSLRESGAKSVIFDLSYFDKSPLQTDRSFLNDDKLNETFSTVSDSIDIVLDSLADGTLSKSNIPEAKKSLSIIAEDAKKEVSSIVNALTFDADDYFAKSLAFTDNAYLAFTMLPYSTSHNVSNNFVPLAHVTAKNDTRTPAFNAIQWPLPELLTNASSAGFVNSEPDSDGYRRRIHLLGKYNGQYYGQLIFVALLDYFGNPSITVSNTEIILHNAKVNKEYKDIKIPRAKDGAVLLRWPQKTFENYNAISAWEIQKSITLEKTLVENLYIMRNNGFFTYWKKSQTPLDFYVKAQRNRLSFSDYLQDKNNFFDATEKFLNGDTENDILLSLGNDTKTAEYVSQLFATVRNQYNQLKEIQSNHQSRIGNAICIIGTTATSTTDYGLTMYQQNAPNIGIHYALANMILNNDFIFDAPNLVSVIFAIILVFGMTFFIHKQDKSKSIIVGIITMCLSIIVPLILWITTKRYVGVILPVSSVFLSFITFTFLNYVRTLREKSFIHSAFSHYLSDEVIKQIINDPSRLSLGGEKRVLTAIFTDIRGFSTISEKLDPEKLVTLLNTYLTTMCNIILANQGTIDKFEGDAIIAFFGAPVETENHALAACLSAVQMKKAEHELNKLFKTTGESPDEIFTRIGINTGDMVVGNMGTKSKMNYTIMGNDVNLASRLEGINKQYNTQGIICSETTWKQTNNHFLGRRLDCVRVVGINTPVRLYEIIDELSAVTQEQKDYIAQWEQAITLFENKDFPTAYTLFTSLRTINTTDGTAQLYQNRCKDYINNPPGKDWDTIVNLTQK